MEDGLISLRSASGVLTTFALRGVEGVLPVMVPRDINFIDVVFLADAEDEGKVIGGIDASVFDSELGTAILVTDTTGINVAMTQLGEGELLKALGLSSQEELDRLRLQILQS